MNTHARAILQLLACLLPAGHAVTQTPCGKPFPVAMPTPAGATRTFLNDVSALTHDDVWAVGHYTLPNSTRDQTFTYALHWDGRTWTQTPTPSPAASSANVFRQCELYTVHAVASDDVWAGGAYYMQFPNNGHIGFQMMVLHWDGNSWTQLQTPIPYFSYMASSSGSRVSDIEVLGPKDIWFFGHWSGDQNTPSMPLALHWDGSDFTMHNTPVVSTRRYSFTDVDAISASEMWGVGGPLGASNTIPYAARFDGSTWSLVTIPTLYGAYYGLSAVAAIRPDDVWIVGSEWPLGGITGPYAIHWDGSSWTRHTMPGFGGELIAFASNDIWSFGSSVQHWDGKAWKMVDDLSYTARGVLRGADSAGGSCDIFAVGTQIPGSELSVFGMRMGGGQAGTATVRLPCTSQLPASLLPASLPTVGRRLTVSVDDVTGSTGMRTGTPTVWALGSAQPAGSCGVALPGFGPNGAAGELLVDPSGLFLVVSNVVWTRRGQPAFHGIDIPSAQALVGVRLYTQAAFVDIARNDVVLTSAVDLRIGR